MGAHIWSQGNAAVLDMRSAAEASLGDDVLEAVVALDELTLVVRPEAAARVLTVLRDHPDLRFRELVDLCGVDYPDRAERFDVVYHLLSMHTNRRVRVKLRVAENVPVPSVVDVFPTAGWFEREAWDMCGIFFADNPDLRRILTDYGFEGHPLRKDFPLTGYVELRYDDEQKRVVYEPVKMRQDWRSWDFLSPWEGDGGLPPGDERAKA